MAKRFEPKVNKRFGVARDVIAFIPYQIDPTRDTKLGRLTGFWPMRSVSSRVPPVQVDRM